MIGSKDEKRLHSPRLRSGVRRSRLGLPRAGRMIALGTCAAFFLKVGTTDAQGFTGPMTPVVTAFANRAVSLFGEPGPAPVDDEKGMTANRLPRLSPNSLGDANNATNASRDALIGSVDRPASSAEDAAVLVAMTQNQPRRGDVNESVIPEDAVIQSVMVDRKITERVSVARNASAVINLKMPVDTVEVADPAIADVYLTSPTRVVVTGRNFGATQLMLRIGDQQRAFHIDVELDLSKLRSFIGSAAPTSQIKVRSINGTVFLTGTVPDVETAQRITDMATLVQGGEIRSNLTVAGVQQTMLRVVVAEVNKEAMRELGVNWSIGGSDLSRDFFFANNVGQINPTTFGSSGLPDVTTGQQLFTMFPTANGPGTNVTFGFPRAEFQLFLNALRENSLARTLAEPNLVAISGQTATFLAGGEVPIPVTQGGAVSGAITIDYREFGIRLAFTPTVLGRQIIRLHVMTEVSEAIPTEQIAGSLPLFTFTTRRVESTIECGNGQTFAIAGLLNDEIRALASKIPALGDLPVLGALFSSTRYERSITELVVLVTPQLVEPLDPHQVPPPPGGLMTEPNDYEFFALQQLEGTPLERPENARVPRDEFPVRVRPTGVVSWPSSKLVLRGAWGMAGFQEN